MKKPEELSAKQLAEKMDSLLNLLLKLNEELINAGRGAEKMSDTLTKLDPISIRYQKVHEQYQILSFERDRRLEYHGNLNKIKQSRIVL